MDGVTFGWRGRGLKSEKILLNVGEKRRKKPLVGIVEKELWLNVEQPLWSIPLGQRVGCRAHLNWLHVRELRALQQA